MESLSYLKALFLGFIQGVTEFLPISSSGHLVIFQQWLGLSKEGVALMALDVALHLGTLGAVVAVFYHEIWQIGKSLVVWTPENRDNRHVALMLLIGTIPAALIGFIFKDFFTVLFADAIPASFFLVITGWILWLTKFVQYAEVGFREMGQKHAWWVGIAQAAAIIPGISRSGATIAMGLFAKLTPVTAVRYSFLLAVPAILGATVLEIKHLAVLNISVLIPILLGVLTAFLVGYFAIRWMLKIVSQHKLHYFAWYCWALGGFVLVKELFL